MKSSFNHPYYTYINPFNQFAHKQERTIIRRFYSGMLVLLGFLSRMFARY